MNKIDASLKRLAALTGETDSKPKTASLTDDNTLGQLVAMAVGSMYDDEPRYADPDLAEPAANKYEDAVERALDKWVGGNLGQFDLGEMHADDADDVVGVLMDARGGAPYLYFMEAEGHGVGTWDGDWDDFFVDGGRKSIGDLSKYMERATAREYQALSNAIMEAADAYAVEEGLVDESEFRAASSNKKETRMSSRRQQGDRGKSISARRLAQLRKRGSVLADDGILGRFEKGKKVDVPKYLRDKGNPGAAEKWEENVDEDGSNLKGKGRGRSARRLAELRKRLAAKTPAGLYGYTKKVQADCEVATRRAAKLARRVAKAAFKRDERVASFYATHGKRARSATARMLHAALKAEMDKVAAEGGTLLSKRDKEAKETGYSMYGMPSKTVKLGLESCMNFRHEVGRIAATLHARRAAKHESITGFFKQHAKAAKCAYAKMLGSYYPDANSKCASAPSGKAGDEPITVAGWLEWEE
jgi:hypothetical protein